MIKQSLIFMTLCASLAGQSAFSAERVANEQGTQQGSKNGERRGPPPEAFAACADKKEGDQSSFKGRRGHDVKGTCMSKHGKLVLVPEHHIKGDKGQERPPQQ